MMRFKDLLEMAKLPDDLRGGMTLYHGTSDGEKAASILKAGKLVPPVITKPREHMAPVPGRVYLTPHLHYAQIYAIGGDVAGSDHHRITGGDHGHVFSVHPDHIKDVQPDEDSVGEFISRHTKGYGRNAEYHNPTGEDDHLKRVLYHNIRSGMTDHQFRQAREGMAQYWASGGKRALKTMSDHNKIQLIRWGSHIAHEGEIPIHKAWRIHKDKVKLLARDGSNFHDHAELIHGG